MSEAVAPAPREQGWRRLLLALAALLIAPVVPPMLLVVPALAVCFLLGWRAGGRFWAAVLWVAIAVYLLVGSLAGAERGVTDLARGWGLLLAGAFGVVSLLATRREFFPRALTALGLTAVLAFVATAAGSASPAAISRALANQHELRFAQKSAELQEALRASGAGPSVIEQVDQQLDAVFAMLTELTAARLALESLLALAFAWGVYHRLSRVRIGNPLAPLGEFRFNDQLVWGVVVGLTIVVLPTLSTLQSAGLNILVFFGALYAVRGLGVLVWYLTPSLLTTALIASLTILALPLLAAVTVGLGLGDTWLDWRNRIRPSSRST